MYFLHNKPSTVIDFRSLKLHDPECSTIVTHGVRVAPGRGKITTLRMRLIYVVVCGGKMAALGDTSAPGVNGLIQQFTAITGKNNILISVYFTQWIFVLI